MVTCLERGADLHMARLMPLPLTVFCFSKIQIGFTFLVPAHLSSPGKRAVQRVCVCNQKQMLESTTAVWTYLNNLNLIPNMRKYRFETTAYVNCI